MSTPSVLSSLLGGAGAVASGAGDAVQTKSQDQANVKSVNPIAGQPAQGVYEGLPGTLEGAQQAAENIGKIQQQITVPQAKAGIEASRGQIQQGQEYAEDSLDKFNEALKQSMKLQDAAEEAMKEANKHANIDPQRYMKQMGIGGATLAALGMMLSGAGAGVTGQPNMAIDLFKTNLANDIESQKQTFANYISEAAAKRGLAETAMDRAKINQVSQQLANITVNNGLSNLMEYVNMAVGGGTARDQAELLKNTLQQNTFNGMKDYAASFANSYSAGDEKHLNLYGIGAEAALRKFGGTGFGPIQNQYGAAQRFNLGIGGVPPQTQNPAMGTSQNKSYSAPPSQPSQPTTESKSESATNTPKNAFFKALSEKTNARDAERQILEKKKGENK